MTDSKATTATIRITHDEKELVRKAAESRNITPTAIMGLYIKEGLKIDLEGHLPPCKVSANFDKAQNIRSLAEIHAATAGVSLAEWVGQLVVNHLKSNPTPDFTGWVVEDDNPMPPITVTTKKHQDTCDD
jgi:hypothetical protein